MAGLSPHVIRVWEKRYGAVTPARTESNRRLYSDEEVERLRLLARATAAGHQIGMIARLGREQLMRLVATVEPGKGEAPGFSRGEKARGGSGNSQFGPQESGSGADAGGLSAIHAATRVWPLAVESVDGGEPLVREALEATRSFAAAALVEVLERGAVRYGHNGVLHRVVCPLAQEMGDLWQRGELTAAHEHFASALIRDTLLRGFRSYGPAEGAPRLIVATPSGQLHELGAVIVSASAVNLGWKPIYLGASLPSAEIAGAAIQNQARAVLLSIVYPSDDRQLAPELRQLRRFLPPSVAIVVGGRAARGYDPVLREIGAVVPADLLDLGNLLGTLRGGVGEDRAGDLSPSPL